MRRSRMFLRSSCGWYGPESSTKTICLASQCRQDKYAQAAATKLQKKAQRARRFSCSSSGQIGAVGDGGGCGGCGAAVGTRAEQTDFESCATHRTGDAEPPRPVRSSACAGRRKEVATHRSGDQVVKAARDAVLLVDVMKRLTAILDRPAIFLSRYSMGRFVMLRFCVISTTPINGY
eukprot:6212107-Pleurochrysis_carterae.AAC.4